MANTEFDVFCPVCNILVEAKVVAEGNGGFRSDALSPIDEVDAEYHGEHYYVCLCGRCGQPFLIRQSISAFPLSSKPLPTSMFFTRARRSCR